jgi:hypothetical protein
VAHNNNKKTEAGRNERFNQPQGVRDFSLVDSPGGYRARLFGAVDSGSGTWTNEMAQGGTRAQRRIAICQSLNVPGQGVLVSNWVGQIDKLSSNSDGKGCSMSPLLLTFGLRLGTMISLTVHITH